MKKNRYIMVLRLEYFGEEGEVHCCLSVVWVSRRIKLSLPVASRMVLIIYHLYEKGKSHQSNNSLCPVLQMSPGSAQASMLVVNIVEWVRQRNEFCQHLTNVQSTSLQLPSELFQHFTHGGYFILNTFKSHLPEYIGRLSIQ